MKLFEETRSSRTDLPLHFTIFGSESRFNVIAEYREGEKEAK